MWHKEHSTKPTQINYIILRSAILFQNISFKNKGIAALIGGVQSQGAGVSAGLE